MVVVAWCRGSVSWVAQRWRIEWSNFKLDQTQVGTLEEAINQDSAHPEKGVATWIQQNQSLVQGWFK